MQLTQTPGPSLNFLLQTPAVHHHGIYQGVLEKLPRKITVFEPLAANSVNAARFPKTDTYIIWAAKFCRRREASENPLGELFPYKGRHSAFCRC
jgi:hypothetical protein